MQTKKVCTSHGRDVPNWSVRQYIVFLTCMQSSLLLYRVSKKYERTGYNGKHIYHKDTSLSEEELQKRRLRLQKLDVAFRKSRDLVVSMQEAKGGTKNELQGMNMTNSRNLPTSSVQGARLSHDFNSNLAALQSMDERLALMRSQIERSAAALALSGRGAFIPPSTRLGGGFGGAVGSRSEMLYSMLIANQARSGMSQFGSPSLPGSFASIGGPAPQSFLQDVYFRRQQLLRTSSTQRAESGMATSLAFSTTPEAVSPTANKRSLASLSASESSSPPIANPNGSVEEPDAKRARAA